MAVDDRIETIYLNIWKGVVLLMATIALIVAVVASIFAVSSLSTSEPFRPVEIKMEDRGESLKQALSLDSFRTAESGGSERPAKKAPNPGDPGLGAFSRETLKKISENLDNYIRTAYPERSPNRETIQASVKNVLKDLKLTNDSEARFYLSTLEVLSGELARAGAVQATLPEEKKIHTDQLLRWHAETVQRLLHAVDQENDRLQRKYRRQLVDYTNKHARILSYASVAASSFAIFVLTVFLFVIIKIERHLRSMAVASTLTTRQLESSIRSG